jgi:probable rRNA maturation factor
MTIQIANCQRLAPLNRRALRAACRRLLTAHGQEADVSLCYVDNAAIRELNRRYLRRDAATDVLAFPLRGGPGPAEDRLLGEVIVSVEKALTEAHQRKIPVEAEIALYTIHGLLHLLGYDDRTPSQKRHLRLRERQALAESGLL